MDELLKSLYDRFYTPPRITELEQEIEENHQLLIRRLEKPERKLVLRIIDAKDSITGAVSLDSFICGFKLAWRLTDELNHYGEGPLKTAARSGLNTHPVYQDEERQ